MNQDEIQRAIEAAIQSKVTLSWLQIAVVALCAGLAAYTGAFIREFAKNQALKTDIRELTGKVKSVEIAYQKHLEDYKQEITRRSQAARISEVLARAIYGNGDEKVEYMKLVWELSIWLPPDLVRKLSVCLVEARKNTSNPKQILIDVRRMLYGNADDLTADQIVHLER